MLHGGRLETFRRNGKEHSSNFLKHFHKKGQNELDGEAVYMDVEFEKKICEFENRVRSLDQFDEGRPSAKLSSATKVDVA